MTAWTLFSYPIQWPSGLLLWLVLPLCASVAIVYKTVRTRSLRRLPLQVVAVFAYMVVGMAVLAVVLWLIQQYAA